MCAAGWQQGNTRARSAKEEHVHESGDNNAVCVIEVDCRQSASHESGRVRPLHCLRLLNVRREDEAAPAQIEPRGHLGGASAEVPQAA